MERRIEKRVDSWESRSFTDGYDELRDLASGEFSGAIDAAGTQLFMLNGRIIGVFGGTIEALEDAQGTVFRAPHPSLALLFTMQQQGGETRAKYYTEDTPLREVDQKLSEGTFTGYIELSENVLSGDYYNVYYGGNAMHAAFVGANERLITGDEAFEQACDEVGIYEVVDVDIEITEIPSPGGDTDTAETDAADAEGHQESTAPSPSHPEEQPSGNERTEPAPNSAQHGSNPSQANDQTQRTSQQQPADSQSAQNEGVSPDATASRTEQPPADSQPPPNRDPQQSAGSQSGSRQETNDQRRQSDQQRRHTEGSQPEQRQHADEMAGAGEPQRPANHAEEHREPGGGQGGRAPDANRESTAAPTNTERSEPVGQPDRSGDSVERAAADGVAETPRERTEPERRVDDNQSQSPGAEPAGRAPDSEAEGAASSRFDKEAAWREADTIPSLDPDRTQSPADITDVPAPERDQRTADQSRASAREQTSTAADEQVEDTFDAEVLEREDQIDRLTQRVANLEAERDDLRRERDELAERVDQLRQENATLEDELELLGDEVERLETELAAARNTDQPSGTAAGAGSTQTGEQQLTATEALSGTDLFVRYDSKSDPTLEDVAEAGAEPAAVNSNLRLEQHTRFDADAVTVDGHPYRSFLTETLEYRFVEWFVTRLPYEIRDTGHTDSLQDLYETYSTIDRAELDGSVSIEYTEDGETVREQATFDVVIRDRMGSPLVVANLNDRRDPASEEMMVELNEAAMRVKESNDSLGAAVLVTESFFSPGALETAAEATGGSFLSRDSRESFVKLSRKRGYHLCLVEARDDDFHLNEPEL